MTQLFCFDPKPKDDVTLREWAATMRSVALRAHTNESITVPQMLAELTSKLGTLIGNGRRLKDGVRLHQWTRTRDEFILFLFGASTAQLESCDTHGPVSEQRMCEIFEHHADRLGFLLGEEVI